MSSCASNLSGRFFAFILGAVRADKLTFGVQVGEPQSFIGKVTRPFRKKQLAGESASCWLGKSGCFFIFFYISHQSSEPYRGASSCA